MTPTTPAAQAEDETRGRRAAGPAPGIARAMTASAAAVVGAGVTEAGDADSTVGVAADLAGGTTACGGGRGAKDGGCAGITYAGWIVVGGGCGRGCGTAMSPAPEAGLPSVGRT